MDRRYFVKGCGAAAGLGMMQLTGCTKQQAKAPMAAAATAPAAFPFYDAMGPLVPIRADADRIFRITVCTRPFRAAGPRYDVVKVGDKTVFCNYGHGGSGWSLSWGSADYVVKKVLADGSKQREIAVIGAGALGLTAGLTAQRAGFKVTIYAKERAPYVRSVRATGSWTPDSRIALNGVPPPEFAAQWEQMARTSFAMYMTYIASPGNPIDWVDHYQLSDLAPGAPTPPRPPAVHDFARYSASITDLTPRPHEIPAGMHPFPVSRVMRSTSLSFNVADYARQLMADFLLAGGTIETQEFHSPNDFAAVPQRDIISCTGYGSRALWSDESVVPVRGQIQWLIPQEGAVYGLGYHGLNLLARRDGIVMMVNPLGDDTGWNDDTEVPDKGMAASAIAILQDLYARMEKSKMSRAS
jgi:glycine/D-amino acid oxidase-like deaminating enzyme